MMTDRDVTEVHRFGVREAAIRLDLAARRLARERGQRPPDAVPPPVVGQFICAAVGGPFDGELVGLGYLARCVDVYAHQDDERTPTLLETPIYLGSYAPDGVERVPTRLTWRGV